MAPHGPALGPLGHSLNFRDSFFINLYFYLLFGAKYLLYKLIAHGMLQPRAGHKKFGPQETQTSRRQATKKFLV